MRDDRFLRQRTVLFVHPGRLTWNLQITQLERKLIFQTSMIMFHVSIFVEVPPRPPQNFCTIKRVINLQFSPQMLFWTFVSCFPPNFVDLGSKQRSFHVFSVNMSEFMRLSLAHVSFVCLCVVLPPSQLMIAQWRKPLGCVADLVVLLVFPLMASQSIFMGLNSNVFLLVILVAIPKTPKNPSNKNIAPQF